VMLISFQQDLFHFFKTGFKFSSNLIHSLCVSIEFIFFVFSSFLFILCFLEISFRFCLSLFSFFFISFSFFNFVLDFCIIIYSSLFLLFSMLLSSFS
jgi:hypothetical protein